LRGQRRETGEPKAQRIVKEELEAAHWQDSDLQARPKGHPEKVKLACRLRKETTMSLNGIAQRLPMGTWTYVSNLLARQKGPVLQPMLPLAASRALAICRLRAS
jgi:hypothetical protein